MYIFDSCSVIVEDFEEFLSLSLSVCHSIVLLLFSSFCYVCVYKLHRHFLLTRFLDRLSRHISLFVSRMILRGRRERIFTYTIFFFLLHFYFNWIWTVITRFNRRRNPPNTHWNIKHHAQKQSRKSSRFLSFIDSIDWLLSIIHLSINKCCLNMSSDRSGQNSRCRLTISSVFDTCLVREEWGVRIFLLLRLLKIIISMKSKFQSRNQTDLKMMMMKKK